MMNDAKKCEFFLLQYVPNIVRGEFVNFGVVLLDPQGDHFADVRWSRDLARVRCLDSNADVEYLRALEDDLRQKLASAADRREMLRLIQESFSNTVQVSPLTSLSTASPSAEIERLAEQYLDSGPVSREARELRGRGLIRHQLQSDFERAGVWSLMMKNIAVGPYTHAGDPLKIDCGYRPNGSIKLFHAVSLAGDGSAVKPLCFSFRGFAAGVARKEKAEAQLTAVVENQLDQNSESVDFALHSFEQARIKVAPLADVPRLAEIARQELRA